MTSRGEVEEYSNRLSHRERFYHDAAYLLLGVKPQPSKSPARTDDRWEKSMRVYVRYLAQFRAAHQKEAVREILEAWRMADLTEEDSMLIARELDLLRARHWISGDWRPAAQRRFEKDHAASHEN